MFRHLLNAFLIGVAINSLATLPSAAEERPNIVVILCDDLGYGDLECYGHPHIKTPNLNQLAEGGIRFTDFYSAAPVCSPSRVGLLTGRSPNRAGVYDWIPPSKGTARPDAREQVHMRASEVTIPQLLQKAGYATCMSGKWHCNSRFSDPAQPQPGDVGFDHWFGTQNNAAPSHENPHNYVRNGEPVGPLEGYSCQLVVDEAVQWLDDRTEKEKPFFAYLAFHEPHEPVASPADLVTHYEAAGAKNSDEAQYYANVANVDNAVGRFVEALDKRKLRQNTLVIFTSDNGPETLKRYARAKRSYGTPAPLRGMKLHTHDAGFRVAGIMNWPSTIKPNQTSGVPVSSLDFLPTFCELAKTEVPADLTIDGQSFLPAISEGKMLRSKPLVWCYFNALNEARVAMRHGKYKVLARLDGGEFPRLQNVTTEQQKQVLKAKLTDFEIYDVEKDVTESKNLNRQAAVPSALLRELVTSRFEELASNSHTWQVTPQTWASKLGWPAEKRVLILHADDIGMCYEANQAAKSYLTEGHIQSAALMVPCPWYNEMANWYKEHPEYDLGLHLALTSEWKTYRWGPVAPPSLVPGLIDKDNYMWANVMGVATHASPEEVERELRAQIEKALKVGPKPGHMDTHMGTLFARADYTQVYLKLAMEYQIPAMAIAMSPQVVEKFRKQGYPLDDNMIAVLDAYTLPKLDDFHSIESAKTYEEKKEKFFAMVRGMNPGLNEVIFHPSVDTEGLRHITGSWQQRIWEAKMFADPEVKRFLEIQKVEFTNWKEIMKRFSPKKSR